MLDTGYSMLDDRYSILDAGCGQAQEFQIQDLRFKIVEAGEA
jgi:hypothetical protein